MTRWAAVWTAAGCVLTGACSRGEPAANPAGQPTTTIRARDTVTNTAAIDTAHRSPQPELFAFAAEIGVVQRGRDTTPTCLIIANPTLTAGSAIAVISLGRPQHVAVARVDSQEAGTCAMGVEQGIGVSIEHASFYRIHIIEGEVEVPGIAVRSSARLAVADSVVTGDLNGDGHAERFTTCASHEGLHLRVTALVGGHEVEVWHQYYYVGYDLEPDCPQSLTRQF